MFQIGGFVFNQLYDARPLTQIPGNHLPGMVGALCFNDRPSCVIIIFAAPLEVMKIPGGIQIQQYLIALIHLVRRFDHISIHIYLYFRKR